jgi:hypothetical protein
MEEKLYELKNSLKELIENLNNRIDIVCQNLRNNNIENLSFWLEDLSVMTEAIIILSKYEMIDFDIMLFNEKLEFLLDKVEEKDYMFIADILEYEVKPLLTYWDGLITNG